MAVAGRVAALAAAVAACTNSLPPRAQLVLYVTTDAPLPPPPGKSAAPGDPPALFDVLRIDVSPAPGTDSPCDDCTRVFSVDAAMVDGGRASIGVAPARDTMGYTARVRLYRGASAASGEPDPDSTLDTTVALPPVRGSELTEVTIVLHCDDVANPVGMDAPVTPDPGRPAPGTVGSWPDAQPVPCAGQAGRGEVCIPGGAYWMGNRTIAAEPGTNYMMDTVVETGTTERLVVLSPFYLSATEVTVAQLRASGVFGQTIDHADSPDCTFTAAPGPDDALPVTCISWENARAYCRKVGGDLPTEAQYEYAASDLRGARYVWGDDPPSCSDAVWGLDGMAFDCGAPPPLPPPPGKGARDRLTPSGDPAEVVDLAGDVSEWCLDGYADQGSACWGTGVFHDPQCTQPVMPHYYAVRGGNFINSGLSLWAAMRRGELDSYVTNALGFRCARPATP